MKTTIQKFLLLLAVGCFAACSSAPEGQGVEAHDAKDVNANTQGQELVVNTDLSLVNWVGSKTGGQHKGKLKIKSGSVKIESGKLLGGSFVLDMTSIEVTDLKGKNKSDLEDHLKKEQFFEANKFPEGTFDIITVTEQVGEEQTHLIEGNLRLKGIKKSVKIPAKLDITENSLEAITPQFTINRQEWEINYVSPMKDVIINDEMGIKIKLVAKG